MKVGFVVVQQGKARAYFSIPPDCQGPLFYEGTLIAFLSQTAAGEIQGIAAAHGVIDRFASRRIYVDLWNSQDAQPRGGRVNGIV
jgi:hypothetical protein